jgi:hypothetical protein
MFLVAAVIASISLALIVAARVQMDASPNLQTLRQDVDQETAARTVGAHLAFLLLSEPIGPRSIVVGGSREPGALTPTQNAKLHSATGGRSQEVRLDGRYYRMAVDGAAPLQAFVSLQDEAGLFNFNSGDDTALSTLLTLLGVPAREGRSLAAILNDYVDEDDLKRAGGAERDDYSRLGSPPPGNHALTSRFEAMNALGWTSSLSEAQRSELWRYVSVAPVGRGVNVNPAP